MGNFDYGKSINIFYDRFEFDIDIIVSILKRNYDAIKHLGNKSGYYSLLDSLILLSILNENVGIKNIIELGCGLTTEIMLNYIKHFDRDGNIISFTEEVMMTSDILKNADNHKIIYGSFLDTYFENPIDFSDVDLFFIDALHSSHFASFFCNEIFPKLKKGTYIHIHDIQCPDVLLEGYEKGYIKLGKYYLYPSITDEIYTILYFIKDKPEYKVLCNSNELLEKHSDLLSFIPTVEESKYINITEYGVAPAESLWIKKE